MSSPPFDATIELAPRPSLRALMWLFWLHTGALVLTLAALPPGPAMVLPAFAVGASWVWTRRHAAFGHGPRALTRLTWHAEGAWTVHDAAGASHEAELQGSSLVLDGLVVLNFRFKSGGGRTRALLGDEVDADLLRRLRARLRMARIRG